ncbi:MAG: wax ester/triacylglycerol synthase family O-acyltransferase [Myxococcota bacterium]
MRTPYERLSPAATSCLAQEGPSVHSHVGATLVFEAGSLRTADGGIDIERIRAHTAAQLHRAPRYRQRLARVPLENSPVWVDDEHFSLDYHLRHTSLPRPGDESQLKHLAARIMSQQLDHEKPLWEQWIVEGVEGDRFAIVSKAHTCTIDGAKGADLLSTLLVPEPTDEIADPREFDPREPPSPLHLLRDEVLRRVRSPLGFARDALVHPVQLGSSVEARARAWVDTLTKARAEHDSVLTGEVGPHRGLDWIVLELADVRAVKKRLGGSVNDVVLAVVAGALRRFLERRGVGLRSLALTALSPISVYSGPGTLADRIDTWRVPLPVGEPDAHERFEQVRRVTRELGQATAAVPAHDLAAATRWTASTLLSRGVLELDRTGTSQLVVSNVPGPQLPLYLLRSRLLACYPQAPLLAHQGLSVALFSYAGRLYWGLCADRERIPDLPLLADEIVASFAELRSAAGLESRRRAAGRRTKTRRRHAPGGPRAEL